MSVLYDELNQYQNMMRGEYMDRLKSQIEIEADARYYRFIIKLADNYRKGNVDIIRQIIDEESKAIEKDIEKLGRELPKVKEREDTILERKYYIPMLEFEYCILTTSPLPKSLFLTEVFREYKVVDPQILNDFSCNIESFFKIPFDYLVYDDGNITHAHVTLTYLSYSPSEWNVFLEKFKENYIEIPSMRFSYLFFLSIWFEMRPKHFLTKFPIFVNFIEDFDDGNLFSKHLCLILKQAKWNVNFMFLPLDAISPFFHLKYLQLSDKNKVIVGVDASSIQNSFKSSMMKKFDMRRKLSVCNPRIESNVIEAKAKDEESVEAGNENESNSNKSQSGGKSKNKKKNKNANNNPNANNNNKNANNNPSPNPNANAKNNSKNASNNPNPNANSNKNASNNPNPNAKNNSKNANSNPSPNPNANNSSKSASSNNNDNDDDVVDDGQNRVELFKAFVVCLLAIQNTLSFDCFLEFGPDSESENSDAYFASCVGYMQTVKFSRTSNLKDIFTLDEFDFWRKTTSKVKCGAEEVGKLVTVANGFSHWIVSLFNSKKPINNNNNNNNSGNSNNNNDNSNNSGNNNDNSNSNDNDNSSNNNDNNNNNNNNGGGGGGDSAAVAATIFDNLTKIYEGVSQMCKDVSNMMKIDIDEIKDDSIRAKFDNKKELVRAEADQNSKNYEIFFTESQRKYEQRCKNFDKNSYKSLIEKIDDILNLLSRKTNLRSPNVIKGADLKLPSEVELNNEDCFNVDPHMLRIVFYNLTQGLFAQKNESDENRS